MTLLHVHRKSGHVEFAGRLYLDAIVHPHSAVWINHKENVRRGAVVL